MDFEELLLLVRRRLALILMLGTLGLALSIVQTSKIIPLYDATATVFVSTPPSLNDVGQSSGNKLGELATGNSFTQARVKSYATIVNNESTLEPVISELDLPYGIQELATKVSATTPSDTVLMYVTAVDKDPVLAAKIANSVAFNFSETVLNIELNSSLDLTQLIKLSVVRNAEPNFVPISPRKNFNYFLGLFAGLMLALLISLFLKFLDKSIKSEKDLGATPLFGVIAFDPTAASTPLVSQLGTYAIRTEAFRLLRTNVLHILDKQDKNCLAVSSCFSGEGKTTTTLNLGLTIAKAGFSVVIVEADMRRPGLFKYLKHSNLEVTPAEVGLSSLLETEQFSTVRRKVSKSIAKLPDSTLEILFAGAIPDNPAELLGGETFVELIEYLKEQYDYVIVDTPPVLAVADASIVGRVTQEILIVLHAGETSKRNFEATREAMLGVGVSLTGVMLNKVPKHKAGEHYGYTYSDPQMGYYRYSYVYSPNQGSVAPEGERSLRSRISNFGSSKSKTREIPVTETPQVIESKSEFEILLEEIRNREKN
jgi:succinoglycan biosynthesis transport protein ExoP